VHVNEVLQVEADAGTRASGMWSEALPLGSGQAVDLVAFRHLDLDLNSEQWGTLLYD
jgi:hypothetical protein